MATFSRVMDRGNKTTRQKNNEGKSKTYFTLWK